MSDEFTLTLNSPITEEQWDMIADVDFDYTNEITFHTKHGKEVKFVKADAQPERKTGKWIPVTNGRGGNECNKCHDYAPSWQTGKERLTAFCPNCGARMVGEQDEDN